MLGLVNSHDYIVLCTRRSLSPLESETRGDDSTSLSTDTLEPATAS
jgi:hypothetical protein